MIDTLIHNGLVVTADSYFTVIPGGAVAVQQGRIAKVWAPDKEQPLPESRESMDAQGAMVLPGLINAHTHLPMSLFRGLADDLPLQQWLNEHIFPAEARYINPETVALGTRLSCAEMLLGGITTCCDGYFVSQSIAQEIEAIGMRAILGQGVIDFPAPEAPDPAQNVAHARSFVEHHLGKTPLMEPSIFCHSPYTCSAQTLQKAKQAARELGVLFQIHVAETRFEAEQCRAQQGFSPVQYLHNLGLLDHRTLLMHAVWTDDTDIRIIADSGARIAHCPESNMKLASGIAPVPDFLAAGITVAIGTDGCASNNDLDLLAEMDIAAKLHKVRRLNPTVMDAVSVFRMATSQGARALGLEKSIGSLEPGKQADLIILAPGQVHLTPLYHPASHLVYTARASDVRHVMIDGRWMVRDRRLLTIDLAPLLEEVSGLANVIAAGESMVWVDL